MESWPANKNKKNFLYRKRDTATRKAFENIEYRLIVKTLLK